MSGATQGGWDAESLARAARDHLWLHFTSLQALRDGTVPIIARGEGCRVWDVQGKEYIDAISGLFAVQIGYGRRELAEAAAAQMEELSFFSGFGYANPAAVRLAEKLAELAPAGIDRTFLVSGGSEAVESAIKLARQYHRIKGRPGRYKYFGRKITYHGTTLGALGANGITPYRTPFEPLLPGARHFAWTNCYRCDFGLDPASCEQICVADLETKVELEGPETVAAVFVEPVQSSGGAIVAPAGYFERVRELCDRHDILLISDEVICAFGRLGAMFGCQAADYRPDIITVAKGLSSGYQPAGGMLTHERLAETFLSEPDGMFSHGLTFGGHPVACAVALKNLEILEREGLIDRARSVGARLRDGLEQLRSHSVVGDVRGMAMLQAIELVKDKATKETFDEGESKELIGGFLTPRLLEAGLICRADDRGDPVIMIAPPLVAGDDEVDAILERLDGVLSETEKRFLK